MVTKVGLGSGKRKVPPFLRYAISRKRNSFLKCHGSTTYISGICLRACASEMIGMHDPAVNFPHLTRLRSAMHCMCLFEKL